MKRRVELARMSEYYKDFRETNPSLVLGLTILTGGLYTINWLYLRNKEFELLDKEAPDSKRGAVIMMVLPFLWLFLMQVFKHLFFTPENIAIGILEIVGYGTIYFLIMKYLLDFCRSFSAITQTSTAIWFLFFFVGSIGILSIIFGFVYTSFLALFYFIVTPAMQAELNSFFTKFHLKKEKNLHYH